MAGFTLLIDGNNTAFRAGMVSQQLENGAVYVFVKTLQFVLTKFSPQQVIVVWDGGTSSWRRLIYPEYKVRPPGDSEDQDERVSIFRQIDKIREELLPLLPISQMSERGVEADDLIYACSKYLTSQGGSVSVLSTDKDFFQMLPMITIYSPIKDVLYTRSLFEKEYGFFPQKWVEYRALVGDPSDRVRGVDGVGEKTAARIVAAYKSVKDFVEDETAPGALRRAKVIEQWDIFERNTKLIDLSQYPQSEELVSRMDELLVEALPFNRKRFLKYLKRERMDSLIEGYRLFSAPFLQLSLKGVV